MFLIFVISLFVKSTSHFVDLFGYICDVNKFVSKKLNIALIGCSSHLFQSAVKDSLKEHETILKEVLLLMVKLRAEQISAKLRRITHLNPKLRNDTRWISTYQMLKSHVEISFHL